jgi:rhamnulokinase
VEEDSLLTQRNYLAFDFGAESGRAILGKLDGDKLTLEERHRFANPNGRMNGELQWDLLGQWEQIKQGLKNARGDRLDGIGVDTWGVDFGFLDATGRILGNPTHYRDTRTAGMADEIFKTVPRADVFSATGVQFMELNSLYQLAALAKQKSPLLEIAERLLFVPDLFNYLLTGVAKNEFSIATTSQFYDPRRRDWARPMLEKLGIPARLLGEIIPSGTVLGPLLGDVAAECDIAAAPVIAPATHDTASAVASVPAEDGTSWCYISSGTWSLMGVELAEPIINDKSLKYNYTNEGGVGGSIRFLKNIMGMWLIQECRRHFTKTGYEHSYAELTQMAARSKAFDVIINPNLPAFVTPGGMPDKIAA